MITARKTLVADYDYVCKSDPAVDKSIEDFDEVWTRYCEGTIDPPIIDGSNPTVWTLRHIGGNKHSAVLHSVYQDTGNAGLAVAAAAMSIVSVENFLDSDGSPVLLHHEKQSGVTVLSDQCLDLLPAEVAGEIGATALRRRSIDPLS